MHALFRRQRHEHADLLFVQVVFLRVRRCCRLCEYWVLLYVQYVQQHVSVIRVLQNLRDALDCMYDATVPKVWPKVRRYASPLH